MATCPNCQGHGEIGFNNSWNHDPQCDDTYTCTYCGGSGEVPDALADEAYDDWKADEEERAFAI